jgi:hypothetical protein
MKMPGESEKLERLRRLVCKNIIEYILKHKEIEDLEQRMAAIESRFIGKRNR